MSRTQRENGGLCTREIEKFGQFSTKRDKGEGGDPKIENLM